MAVSVLDSMLGAKAADLRTAVLNGPQADGWRPTDCELEQYTQGECHILAIALHRRLGWPMVALVDWDDPYAPGVPAVAHVMLEVPGEANLCIDINGWTSTVYLQNEVFFDLSDPESVWNLIEQDVLDWSGEGWDRPLYEVREEDLAEADQVATRLIERLGLQDLDNKKELRSGMAL